MTLSNIQTVNILAQVLRYLCFFVFVNFNLSENRAYKVAENFKNLCVIAFADKNYSLIPLT